MWGLSPLPCQQHRPLTTLSEPAYFPVDQIVAAADHVIDELRDDAYSLVALPIPHGLRSLERSDLLDHHRAVVAEIRRRGWRVRTNVRHVANGDVFAIVAAVYSSSYQVLRRPAALGLRRILRRRCD
jgi:hypothetical protein